MDLTPLRDLYEKGKFQDLLTQLTQMGDNDFYPSLSPDQRIECVFYKCHVLITLGKYEESLEIATQSRATIPKPEEKTLTLVPLSVQIGASISMGRLQEALKFITEGNEILDSLTAENNTLGTKWITSFLLAKGSFFFFKGDAKSALECFERSLSLRKALGSSHDIAEVMNWVGELFSTIMGKWERSLEHYHRALDLGVSIGNPYIIATAQNGIGLILYYKGELNSALEYSQKSLALWEQIGNPTWISSVLISIGSIFTRKGELDRALELLNRSLTVREQLENPWLIANVLDTIGNVYWLKSEFSDTEKYHLRSLNYREAAKTAMYKVMPLMCLLQIALEQKDSSKAQTYLAQLHTLQEQFPDKLNSQAHRLGEALILKASSRIVDKSQAQKILGDLLDEEIATLVISREFVMIHLCELLLGEFKAYSEAPVFQEAKTLVQELLALAKRENSFSSVVSALILQTKFAMIEGDFTEAQDLINQAAKIAEEKSLGLLLEKTSTEKKTLEEELGKWQDLVQRNVPFQERLEQARVLEYVKIAQKLISVEK